ncbi:hypothetical protein BAE44_0002932 [Dichanthelium oligosanthes]|uniref:DUF3615 domain-containing protein n=1 Tax=Dichanthelium oligosanthes TaxID=888268 RepID=A0A1E5WFW3_9POAL|nr:hypothetical protein BAE44_0002932 [Dichanthelium oligosanthes]
MSLVDWSTGKYAPWTSPTVLDLLPDLSDEEKRRLRLQGRLPEREEDIPRFAPPGPPHPVPCAGVTPGTDAAIILSVRHALHHYNARHPAGEFEAVKLLAEDGLHFRDEVWSHANFWARSRSSKKIKRFFAEVHYKAPPCPDPSSQAPFIATVETCTIIEEPLTLYRKSCAFCRGYLDILHPMDDSEFVCGRGNEEDWNVQEWFGMRFICRKGETFPFSY